MSVLFPALPGGAQRKVSFSCSVFGLHARVTVVPKRQADAAAPAGPAAAGKVACDKGQASPYRRRSTPGILPLPLPAKGNHPDDTPVLGSSLVRTTHALPPMLPRALASQPCQAVSKRKAQQLSSSNSSKDLVLFHSVLPRVSRSLACSAVDAPFNNTLVALQASFRCANRGLPVEMISNILQNVVPLSASSSGFDSAGLMCAWL